MNVEEVKHLIEMRKIYPAHKNIVNAKLFTEGLDILINEIERLNSEVKRSNDYIKYLEDKYGTIMSKHEILYNLAHELTSRKLGCDLSYYGEEGTQEFMRGKKFGQPCSMNELVGYMNWTTSSIEALYKIEREGGK